MEPQDVCGNTANCRGTEGVTLATVNFLLFVSSSWVTAYWLEFLHAEVSFMLGSANLKQPERNINRMGVTYPGFE